MKTELQIKFITLICALFGLIFCWFFQRPLIGMFLTGVALAAAIALREQVRTLTRM